MHTNDAASTHTPDNVDEGKCRAVTPIHLRDFLLAYVDTSTATLRIILNVDTFLPTDSRELRTTLLTFRAAERRNSLAQKLARVVIACLSYKEEMNES